MKKNRMLQKAVSVILSFFLAVLFFVIYVGMTLWLGYLPGNLWKRQIADKQYQTEIAAEAEQKLTDLLMGKGIPENVAKQMVEQEKLSEACRTAVSRAFSNQEQSDDWYESRRETFQADLKKHLAIYFSQNQVVETESMKAEIENTVADAGWIYQRYIYPNWLSRMKEYRESIRHGMMAGMVTAVILAAICMILLLTLYHYKHRAVRFICYSIGTSCILSIPFLYALYRNSWLEQAGIASSAYRKMIGQICTNGMWTGIFLLGVQVLLLLMSGSLVKRLKHTVR